VKFCVWLPTSDYQQLLQSLGGNPGQKFTAVTIAGEDLLVAQHGKWAVLMDPDQSERMTRLLTLTGQARPAVAAWQRFVDANDIAAVAFSGGVHELLSVIDARQLQKSPTDSAGELFGTAPGAHRSSPPDQSGTENAPTGIVANLRRMLNNLQIAAPQLMQQIDSLESLGIGLRVDDDRNASASLNATWRGDGQGPIRVDQSATGHKLPLALFRDGEFIFHGAADLPPALAKEVATAYVRLRINELTSGEQIRLDEQSLNRFFEAVEQAAAEITAATVLTLPGDKDDGVYTNSFLAVQLGSADTFVDLATEAMRLWNQMNREGQGGPRLVFDVEDISLDERKAVQYSLDLAAADDAQVLPETRQAMEKLFGPGGKLRTIIVKVDEHTALLAGATADQVAAMLEQLDRKQPLDWQQPPIADVNRLLPQQAHWRAFFNPHGYTLWKSREAAAIVGTEVIGGPLVKDFPSAPPIGIAGGVKEGEIWLNVALPADTIRATGAYLQPRRKAQ
jgi:hypothetical protein